MQCCCCCCCCYITNKKQITQIRRKANIMSNTIHFLSLIFNFLEFLLQYCHVLQTTMKNHFSHPIPTITIIILKYIDELTIDIAHFHTLLRFNFYFANGVCLAVFHFTTNHCSLLYITNSFSSKPQWGVPKIHIVTVVASRTGLELLAKTHPDISVTVGMVDDQLTDCGVVLPGLGDVGDRLFGTGNYDFDSNSTPEVPAAASSAASAASEDSASQPNRRKRSASLELEMEHVSKK